MVGTRHSDAGHDIDETGMTEKQKRDLRKLRIDAKDAILGDAASNKPSRPPTTTIYHYRGATYEVQGTEPEEWMDAEPERHKKRKSMAVDDDDPAEHVSKKRKMDVSGESEEAAAAAAAAASPPIHRTRGLPDRRPSIPINDQQPRRRRRPKHTARMWTQQDEEAARKNDRMWTSRAYNYGDNTRGLQDDRPPFDHNAAIAEARSKGYQISPLPPSAFARPARMKQTAAVVAECAKVNAKIRKAVVEYRAIEKEWANYKKTYPGMDKIIQLQLQKARKDGLIGPDNKYISSRNVDKGALKAFAAEAKGTDTSMLDAGGISEGRAEQTLSNGCMWGESKKQRDKRFEREAKFVWRHFVKGEELVL